MIKGVYFVDYNDPKHNRALESNDELYKYLSWLERIHGKLHYVTFEFDLSNKIGVNEFADQVRQETAGT